MRPLLVPGDIIQVNKIKYWVKEIIGEGRQAVIYRCSMFENTSIRDFCVKEFVPEWVEQRHQSTTKVNYYKHILVPQEYRDEWQKLKVSVLASERLIKHFWDDSVQSVFLSEDWDEKRMTFKMAKAPSSCKTLSTFIHEWKTNPPVQEGDDTDLPRIRKSAEIMISLIKGIESLHYQDQVIHGDLTVSNVLWTDDGGGIAFPIDFACCMKIGCPNEELGFHSPGYTHPFRKDASVQMDMYSLAAIFIALATGGYCMADSTILQVKDLTRRGNIRDALSRVRIPTGVRKRLEMIISRAAEATNDPYCSVSEFLRDTKILLQIIDRREMHPEVLFDASTTDYKEQCESRDGMFRYEVEPDLLSEAIDCESHQPINLLKKNTILLGSGGAGKTTKIRALWEICLDNWYADRENSPIPIFVPLNTFDSSEDGKNFIKDYIAGRYFPNLSKDDSDRRGDLMGMLRSRGRYVLFLDGINEAVGNDKLNAEIADFAAIENVTVLITSRNDWGDDETKKLFSTAELLPLNDDLIIKKLHDKELGSPSHRLLETLRRPMFLAMYLKSKITDKKVETPGQILREHHNYLIEAFKTGHHCDELECFKLVIQQILPKIASSINSMMCNSEQIYAVVKDIHFKSAKFRDIADSMGRNKLSRNATSILQNCGILRKINEDDEGIESFIFAHQNYLDFYQALDVYNQMVMYTAEAPLPAKLSSGILPEILLHFLGDLFGEHATQANCKRNTSKIEEWLQDNCTNKGDYPAQIAIRNLIETMKISTGKRLQKRCFRNLDLTLTNFYECDLRGSDFSCSKIGDATFLCQGHDNPIDELLVIPEKKWILSSSSAENYIYIWDAETGAQVGFVGGNNDPLSAFSVSADKKTIITDEFYHVAIYSLENREKIPCGRIDYSALEEDSSKEIHEPQNYKWLSADNREVFFAIRGSRKLGVDQLEESALAKCINKTASAYFSFDHPIQCCEMSADYSHLYITLSNGELWIWDTKQKTCLTEKKYIVPCNANRLAVDPCERYALLCTDTNELFEINLHTGTSNKVNADVSLLKDDDKLLFATASRYYLWYDGNSLFSVDRDNQKFANMSITGITSMYLDWENDKVYLGSSRGEIKVADAKTLRILSTLDCGERNDWRKPHNFVPHWYDGGLARITKHNRIQCLTSDGFKMLQVSNSVCNCFDGNYHICLVEEKNSKFSLVISDLCGGTVVENIPFDNLCKAYNTKGEEIFGVYSEFNWVKYFPQKGKVIVNYSAGLLKCWDVNECVWHSIGYWDREVEQMLSRYDCFEPNDWEMIEETLADISMRNHIFGNHIVQGTSSGHLLWWDFDGNLCRDDQPHRRSTKIYPVPDSMFFITEGMDFVRCIWNWETMELVDSDQRRTKEKRGNVLKILQKRDALPIIRDKHCDMHFWYEYLEHTVLICCAMEGYHDLKSVNCYGDVVVYTTNHYICVCGLYDDKCDDKYLLRTFKTLLTEDVDSWVNYSLSDNDLLAIAFADGTVKIFDIHQNATMFYCPDSEWYVTSAVDVSECKFNQATVKGWIEYSLLMNGACFDNESAQHSLRMHNWVRLFEQQKKLRKEIDEDPYDEEKWIRLFSDFGSNMSGKELRHLIHDLQENFDDTGMRRAVFGNAIDDIYSDEENMLNSIPKTTDGLQTLCRYLRKHLECEYGFNMLFDDFRNVLDVDTRTSMKELLLGNFNLEYLKWTYPHEFGYPDLDDEDMYDKDHLLYDDEIF